MSLLRKLLWLLAFGVCTFGFVVVFEHGCCDRRTLTDGAVQELEALAAFVRGLAPDGK